MQREREEENLLKRKLMIQSELDKQVSISKEMNLSGTVQERTQKFYDLREQLYEYVKKTQNY